jgi:hypothetical protein
MKIDFAGTLKADGTLAGTMAFPQGEIPDGRAPEIKRARQGKRQNLELKRTK